MEKNIKDGRIPLEKLYKAYLSLPEKNWGKRVIFVETLKSSGGKKIKAPIFSFYTKKTGKALWLIAGVHGEEPAGPNALAKNIKTINKLANQGIPMVFLPICNPKGYELNWRYPNSRRNENIGNSVSDSEHLLLSPKTNRPRMKFPSSKQADAITKEVINLSKTHPPLLAIDFHEDETIKGEYYIYSQGKEGFTDPIVREIVRLFEKSGLKFMKYEETRFGESVKDGIIYNIRDGSIDELLAAKKIFVNGKVVKKAVAKSVIVTETPVKDTPIEKRVKIDTLVIESLDRFWKMISGNK